MKSPVDTIQEQIEAERLLEATLRRMNAWVMGLTLGMIGATALFLATLVLVIRGGEDVGAHLGLLSNFFWGYDVSWSGLVPALFYGGLSGFVVGYVVSRIYNLLMSFKSEKT